jgi:predicted AAA+ superfamily ATPase
MVHRPIWLARLRKGWEKAPIVWLTGVRRTGKTVLASALGESEFLNCDLPSTVARLRDPEGFYRSIRGPFVVFDEVHQLPDPSLLLKIGADAFPKLKILATGSSTLAATQKFRDSLAGRKRSVELFPVLAEELPAFDVLDLRERLLKGGLPPALLAKDRENEFYAEWLDSYFARDVQELFRLNKRGDFLRFVELALRQSGGMLEVTSLAKHTGVSRPTAQAWLDVLQITHVAYLVRPYAEGGRREILAQPKLYGFDTGFVSYARGWDGLRPEDCGQLWEHLVLDTLRSIPFDPVLFWRDKQQREVDFVLPRGRKRVDVVECKWSADSFDVRGIAAFRENYPQGRNLVVAPDVTKSYVRKYKQLQLEYVPLQRLRKTLAIAR